MIIIIMGTTVIIIIIIDFYINTVLELMCRTSNGGTKPTEMKHSK